MRTALTLVSVCCLGSGGLALSMAFLATSDPITTAGGFLLLLVGVVTAIVAAGEGSDSRQEDHR